MNEKSLEHAKNIINKMTAEDIDSLVIGYIYKGSYGDVYFGDKMKIVFLLEHIKSMIFRDSEVNQVVNIDIDPNVKEDEDES